MNQLLPVEDSKREGESLPVQCPICRTSMYDSAKFCPGCGEPRTAVRLQLERGAAVTGIPFEELLQRAKEEHGFASDSPVIEESDIDIDVQVSTQEYILDGDEATISVTISQPQQSSDDDDDESDAPWWDELEKLSELRYRGLVTEEEYQTKKRQILDI